MGDGNWVLKTLLGKQKNALLSDKEFSQKQQLPVICSNRRPLKVRTAECWAQVLTESWVKKQARQSGGTDPQGECRMQTLPGCSFADEAIRLSRDTSWMSTDTQSKREISTFNPRTAANAGSPAVLAPASNHTKL